MGHARSGRSRRGCRRTDRRGGALIIHKRRKDETNEETRNSIRSRGGIDGGVRSGLAWRAASWRLAWWLSSRLARWLSPPSLPRRVLGSRRTVFLAGIRRRGGRRCRRDDLGASVLFRDRRCAAGSDSRDNADGRSTTRRGSAARGRAATRSADAECLG